MKIIMNYMLLCLSLLWVCSCSYEDLSSYDTVKSTEIVIDTTGIPSSHLVNFGDTLRISPTVTREGTTGDHFTYQWRLSLNPGNDNIMATIGTERALKAAIKVTPDAAKYRLWYIVTDNLTGLKKDIVWSVEVQASSGKGLVVAHTKDNQSFDFDVLMSEQFSPATANPDYVKPEPGNKDVVKFQVYLRNMYSLSNGKRFDGNVQSLYFSKEMQGKRNVNFLYINTVNGIERVNTLDFRFDCKDRDLFYDPDLVISPLAHDIALGFPFYVGGDGKLIQREKAKEDDVRKFGIPKAGNYVANKFISVSSSRNDYSLAFYDEVNGKFWGIGYYPDVTIPAKEFAKAPDNLPFDSGNVKGFKVLGSGCAATSSEHRFVLKNEKTSKVFIYCLNQNSPFRPKAIYDISNAPKIDIAKNFIVCYYQNVIYYQADNEIYAIILGASTPRYELKFTAPATITHVSMYVAVTYIQTTNLVLLVSTYDGSEGKIHALPLINLGTGNLDVTNMRVYDGFGKISCVTAQD